MRWGWVAGVLLLAGAAGAANGVSAVTRCSSPVCANEQTICTITVKNTDGEGVRWAVIDARLVVHNVDGDVSIGNVLAAPVVLPFGASLITPIAVVPTAADVGATIAIDGLTRAVTADVDGVMSHLRGTRLVPVVDCPLP